MSDGDGSCSAKKDSRPTGTNKPIDVSCLDMISSLLVVFGRPKRCDKKRERILTAASLLNQKCLKPLHQLHIPEPAEVVVEAARIVVGITFEGAKGLRRIFAQDVVATNGKPAVVQQRLPARQTSRCLFNGLLALFAALYLFAILGIACHRALFHRLVEDQIVGQLAVEEDTRFDPVLDYAFTVIKETAEVVSALFSEPIEVTPSDAQIDVVPIPG